MKAVLPSNLPDFTQSSILVVGDVMLDRYFFGDAVRISPEAPVPVVHIKSNDERPGGAANVALNVAALGIRTALMGITGEDEAARILGERLQAAFIAFDFWSCPSRATIIKQRIICNHQQLIRIDFEKAFTDLDHDSMLSSYHKHLANADLVILSDYGKGTLADPQRFIQQAYAAGVPVLVDPKGIDFTRYRNATLITPNFREFEAVVGHCLNEKEIESRGQELIEQLGLKALLLTRGDQGMTLIQPSQTTVHFPAYAREVYDVTGAGDTVIAVLGAALAARLPITEAIALANMAASIAVTKLGNATVSVPELNGMLQSGSDSAVVLRKGVVNEDQLLSLVQQARLAGKKIIFTNGCFDVLHAGHVAYLQQAKQLGDYLIVAVNGDESLKRLKGVGRPVNTVEARAMVLSGLAAVDWVVPFVEDTPERLLRRVQPDVLVKGGDYTVDQVVGGDIVRADGGEVRVLRFVSDVSTTAIINRIREQVPLLN